MNRITRNRWAILALLAILLACTMAQALDSRKFDPAIECEGDDECEERNPHLLDA